MNNTKYYLLKNEEGGTVAVITSGPDFEERLKKAISEEYCGDTVKSIEYPHCTVDDLHSRVGFTVVLEADMVIEDEDEGLRSFTLEQVILY